MQQTWLFSSPASIVVLTADLLPPFHLQEGRVGLMENKLCDTLPGQRLGKDRPYFVYEEMLCAGDLLTGKAMCQVSEPMSVLPSSVLRASVFPGWRAWVTSSVFVETPGPRFALLCLP